MTSEQSKIENQDISEKQSTQNNKINFEFALFQIQKLQELMQRSDSKSQFILGANTVLISVFVILIPSIRNIFLVGSKFVIGIYGILLLVFALTNLISMIIAFLVVFPSYSPLSSNTSPTLFYFREIARFRDFKEYKQALSSSSLDDLLDNAASEIYGVSLAACRKYKSLRRSTIYLIISSISWTTILFGTLFFQ